MVYPTTFFHLYTNHESNEKLLKSTQAFNSKINNILKFISKLISFNNLIKLEFSFNLDDLTKIPFELVLKS